MATGQVVADVGFSLLHTTEAAPIRVWWSTDALPAQRTACQRWLVCDLGLPLGQWWCQGRVRHAHDAGPAAETAALAERRRRQSSLPAGSSPASSAWPRPITWANVSNSSTMHRPSSSFKLEARSGPREHHMVEWSRGGARTGANTSTGETPLVRRSPAVQTPAVPHGASDRRPTPACHASREATLHTCHSVVSDHRRPNVPPGRPGLLATRSTIRLSDLAHRAHRRQRFFNSLPRAPARLAAGPPLSILRRIWLRTALKIRWTGCKEHLR